LTKKAPYKGPGADSEEKREPVSDINTAVVDSLKVLDLKRPIREADKPSASAFVADWTNNGQRVALGLNGSAAFDPFRTSEA
jgi:hypothetical protein